MNIVGEYSINYNIYTMFNVYNIQIKNHNLITNSGYEFFLEKWYKDELYPIELGYYHENKFYRQKNIDDTYDNELGYNGKYSTTTNYIDKSDFRQYKFDGEKFVDFNEKINRVCIGVCDYKYNDEDTQPSETDTDLYSKTENIIEYVIDDVGEFVLKPTELLMRYEVSKEDLNGTTEIGVKTNHGRLISHDIHAPYNLPFGTNIILEYVFKLK